MNVRSTIRHTIAVATLGFAAFLPSLAGAQTAPTPPPQPETAPGVVITNTATATYTDANNQNYSAASNTVSTTVQNAPSLVISPQSSQNVADNQTVLDNFTLYNTGNANATFALTTPPSPAVGTNGTFVGYVINNNATGAAGTCSIANPCTTIAAVNSALANLPPTTPVGATNATTPPIVGIEYTVSATAAPNSTVTTTLSATSSQPTAGGQPAQTSVVVTSTDTDTVLAAARLDIQKTVTPAATAGGNISYTITGNNGGGFAARDLSSVNALLGTAAGGRAGILVTDKIPTFAGGTPTLISVTGALSPSLTGDAYTVVYSTDPNGAGSWTATAPTNLATVKYVGLFIYSTSAPTNGVGGNPVLPSNPSGSTGAGNANPPPSSVSNAQFTLTLSITQPTGAGSGESNALSNIANGVAGGNPRTDGLVPIIGPGISTSTYDSNSTTILAPAVTNTTSSSGTTPPGGASNTVLASAYASAVTFVGPIGFPEASGQGPTLTTGYTNNNDFTAIGFLCANASATVFPSSQIAGSCTVPTAGVEVPGTIENKGNAADPLTITVVPPTGYSAALYTTTCPPPSGGFTILPSKTLNPAPSYACTRGTAFGTTAGNGTATGVYPYGGVAGAAVPSQGTGDFIAVFTYTAGTTANPGVTPSVVADATITVAGTQTATFSADSNQTHDDLYPGGALSYSKVQKIISDGCPTAGGNPAFPASPVAVCPGGVIEYDLSFADTAPAGTVSTAGNNTEPGFATSALRSLTLTMSENGASTVNGTANSWATYTFGMDSAITTTLVAGTAAPSISYGPGSGFSTGTYPAKSSGYTGFTATVSPLNPGQGGTLAFRVTVK